MRSYIKIYGPPVYDSLKALEKMAIDMPQVCIMDHLINQFYNVDSIPGPNSGSSSTTAHVMEYFVPLKRDITPQRCGSIISKSGERLGESDFFFEWFKEPTLDDMNQLIQKIDATLKPLGCRYTITTKK